MTILYFSGFGAKLTCTPPNDIDLSGTLSAALVYFNDRKSQFTLTANFVLHSPKNGETMQFLGMSDGCKSTMYVPVKQGVREFTINILDSKDLIPTISKAHFVAIVKLQ